jgi:chromosomal replication initiator protein
MNLWEQVLAQIEPKLNPQSFSTWFKPTQLLTEQPDRLEVGVPSELFASWIRRNYTELIRCALRDISATQLEVRFSPAASAPRTAPPAGAAGGAAPPASAPVRPAEGAGPGALSPRYNFNTFVVSSCNQFAHAAALAVAELPSNAYNPLYVYGGVGLGKTHLMHAIGNYVRAKHPQLRYRYISSENFMNELINAIRFEKTLDFKDKYRSIDVLLIDDIQFLAGKERTQEEFFHTFNALYESQKQIVMTSDCPPREIPTLEERLRSRFEWGLIADIQPPDLETKIAILRKKAEVEGVELPGDVALFVASKIKSNIRELEGSLIRILAFASLTGREVTLELAQETLKDILEDRGQGATVDQIQRHVANYYQLKVSELKAKSNSKMIAFPRQVSMYLCKNLTDASLPEIGRRFGGKHHSTVLHSIRKIDEKRRADGDFDRLIRSFIESLQ